MIGLPARPSIFALEDTSAQITWRRLPPGELVVECDGRRLVVETDGGPGVADIEGLAPDSPYVATCRVDRVRVATLRFRTLPSPPGPELYRLATLSDVHFGRTRFGLRNSMTEDDVDEAHPIRCARAAAGDLIAWGAERLVVKGDLVDSSTPESWRLAKEFLDGTGLPYDVLPGNHEMAHGGHPWIEAGEAGVDLVERVRSVDVPGVRLVLMNSAVEGIDIGRWHHLIDPACEAVGGTEGPALVLVHHQPQIAPIPLHFPPGISSISAKRLTRSLLRENPAVMGSSGHSHRNRRRVVVGVPWTEVGSPKDYPGSWGGYVVHEGGIRQVVRRVSDPDCLRWLDYTRRAVGGLWGLWSPGRLRDRCFTHVWPMR